VWAEFRLPGWFVGYFPPVVLGLPKIRTREVIEPWAGCSVAARAAWSVTVAGTGLKEVQTRFSSALAFSLYGIKICTTPERHGLLRSGW
jgi:hypothetical protein